MSSHPLRPLLDEIHELEKRVSEKIQQTAESVPFRWEGKKIHFEAEVRRRHRELVKRIPDFLRESSLLTIATAPVIYALLIPISMLDLFVTIYQWICFRIYRIPIVRRSEYVVIDRHLLGYLNLIEKVNCVYCGYSNGVLGYAREIASRTEQYWCPIKHARRVKGCHSRQCLFCDYGEGENFHVQLEELRQQFGDLE